MNWGLFWLVAIILGSIGGAVWWFLFRKPASPPPAPGARTYQELKGPKSITGKCDSSVHSTPGKSKSSDDCAKECTAATKCTGYDWDKSCNLYADAPKAPTKSDKGHCYIANLTK